MPIYSIWACMYDLFAILKPLPIESLTSRGSSHQWNTVERVFIPNILCKSGHHYLFIPNLPTHTYVLTFLLPLSLTHSAPRPVAAGWGNAVCFAAAPTPVPKRWWCQTACASSTTDPKLRRPAFCAAAPRTNGCSGSQPPGERYEERHMKFKW